MDDRVIDWTVRDGLIEYGWSRFLMAELEMRSLGMLYDDRRWSDDFPGTTYLESAPLKFYDTPTGADIRRFYRRLGRWDYVIIATN